MICSLCFVGGVSEARRRQERNDFPGRCRRDFGNSLFVCSSVESETIRISVQMGGVTPTLSSSPLNLQLSSLELYRPVVERAGEPHLAERQRREFFEQLHRWLRQGYAVKGSATTKARAAFPGGLGDEYRINPRKSEHNGRASGGHRTSSPSEPIPRSPWQLKCEGRRAEQKGSPRLPSLSSQPTWAKAP